MLFLLSLILIKNGHAQTEKIELTKKDKKAIITSIQKNLNESYVNLELSNKMVTELNRNVTSEKYKSITNPKEFSDSLTEDLQKISNDFHLKVNFEPKRIAQSKKILPDDIKAKRERVMAMKMAEINFGFSEVKILNGNIGYLDLHMFADIKYAKDAATAAMNFLSNTNAIIIDLRANRGGVPSMMQLLSSYFTEAKPALLSDFYERRTDSKTQLFTFKNIDGKRKTNTPLYILTSKNTFSAAEAFSYTLKHLDKATLVGEVTKGGANRTKRFDINDQFTISIPYIESIHPVTKTNWEGKGVKPNIETSKKDAFVTAYIDAVNTTVKRNKNDVLNKIGYMFLQDNLVDNAIIVFQENVRLFPNEANAWDSLGEAYFLKRDKDNALKSYRKALELDPNSKSAQAIILKLENIK
jgi:tetratricopeptide (TPR) repeat protein